MSFASEDWLHQPYRGGIIPGFFEIQQQVKQLGACAVFLSGAGPSILVVSQHDMQSQLQDVVSSQEKGWQVKPVKVDFDGISIIKD